MKADWTLYFTGDDCHHAKDPETNATWAVVAKPGAAETVCPPCSLTLANRLASDFPRRFRLVLAVPPVPAEPPPPTVSAPIVPEPVENAPADTTPEVEVKVDLSVPTEASLQVMSIQKLRRWASTLGIPARAVRKPELVAGILRKLAGG